MANLFARKPLDKLMAEAAEVGEHSLKRSLGPINLVALGIGAIIGAGLFVRTASAIAERAGPSVVLAFVVAGIGCLFAGLCYAEFSSMIPVAGSAYTYAYASMGEFVAWIIGWDLILEYLFGASTVAVGWSGYVSQLLSDYGIHLPAAFSHAPLDFAQNHLITTGAFLNVPAVLIVAIVTTVLVIGIRESAGTNAVIVFIKV